MDNRILATLVALGMLAAIGTAVTAIAPTASAFNCDAEHGRPSGCSGNPHSGPTKDGGNPHHPPNDEGNPHFCPAGQEAKDNC